MMYNFCTLFDKNYLSRGLALLGSLEPHLTDFNLYVLCLDKEVFQFFSENHFNKIILIKLSDLEKNNYKLQQAKLNRSVVEYYFTLSPCLPLYILQNFPEIDSICSLDADIYFYSSPKPIFRILDTKSIIITPHKYAGNLKRSGIEKYGHYNVSFQIFKNNKIGLQCLKDWEAKCLEWCYDVFDETNQRYADQKYLDNWVNYFPEEVHVLNDVATGLAVWNIDNFSFSLKDGKVYVNDNEELIFYHFHYFKIINSMAALNGFGLYDVKNPSDVLVNNIYLIYWKALEKHNSSLKIQSDNSLRHNFTKPVIMLLLSHKTGFIKIFSSLFKLNFTFLHKLKAKLTN